MVPLPTTTPFTFWYLVGLFVTTLVIRVVDPAIAAHLLAWSSTSAQNIAHHPGRSLVASALWLADPHWLAYAFLFAVALAPLERRVGSRWTFAIFASGHVVASLATELPVLWAVRQHLLPRSDGHLIDVGVSYGLFATAGALLCVLRGPWRWTALAAAELGIVLVYLADGPGGTDASVTALGHLLALHLGLLGWLPWLRRRGLVGTLRPATPSWLRTAARAVVLSQRRAAAWSRGSGDPGAPRAAVLSGRP
ncbi:rhomboid-like protein [Solihabitans fulvus]|uniref:rhomboid-like protein n=1 Tax=Solihabitans fulvus TaxID=1892852 RepID=UPI001661D998|nr:rhomboid-like protein [Solihabitans fulvus]